MTRTRPGTSRSSFTSAWTTIACRVSSSCTSAAASCVSKSVSTLKWRLLYSCQRGPPADEQRSPPGSVRAQAEQRKRMTRGRDTRLRLALLADHGVARGLRCDLAGRADCGTRHIVRDALPASGRAVGSASPEVVVEADHPHLLRRAGQVEGSPGGNLARHRIDAGAADHWNAGEGNDRSDVAHWSILARQAEAGQADSAPC